MSIVTELTEFGHRLLAEADKEAIARIAAGDTGRAVAVIGEAAALAEAMERQKRLAGDSGP